MSPNYDEDQVVYRGKIFEVIQQHMRIDGKNVTYEIARRSPGVRLLIVKNNKILLTREYRRELHGYDYRLPGGKVFDTLAPIYRTFTYPSIPTCSRTCSSKTRVPRRNRLSRKEAHPLETTHAGATIEWDLVYFLVTKTEQATQALEHGERISPHWKTFTQVRTLCLSGKIHEDRSVGVILKFLDQPRRKPI